MVDIAIQKGGVKMEKEMRVESRKNEGEKEEARAAKKENWRYEGKG